MSTRTTVRSELILLAKEKFSKVFPFGNPSLEEISKYLLDINGEWSPRTIYNTLCSMTVNLPIRKSDKRAVPNKSETYDWFFKELDKTFRPYHKEVDPAPIYYVGRGPEAPIEDEIEILKNETITKFNPHEEEQFPDDPGIYLFWSRKWRSQYVGQSIDVGGRIPDHGDKHWYRSPTVAYGHFIYIPDQRMRDDLEMYLIRVLNPEYNEKHTTNLTAWWNE